MKDVTIQVKDDEELVFDNATNSYLIMKKSVIENNKRKEELKKDIEADILKLWKRYEKRIVRKYKVDINITFEATKTIYDGRSGGGTQRSVTCNCGVNITDAERTITY